MQVWVQSYTLSGGLGRWISWVEVKGDAEPTGASDGLEAICSSRHGGGNDDHLERVQGGSEDESV
ncbi:hypothetical protein DACRYDRAFT_22779 [Dacryopinax primogenitus]|uniref:Uncharacterized protein n=1 Tax=Dacryopinax primogenitus (strain DJM 731) TaxID=1858805 RepID=M5FYI1_DACPD|nr:uncharacterized protein DACRYDRAFT_22779 [Dacryopinax primogenitus]EJU00925.1 hypothetical protein DACRYDRAFT_22779 [Dacryopinax primogenitus]